MRKILLAIIIGFFMAPGTVVAQQTSAKLCSAVAPNDWRDTIVLPPGATWSNYVFCSAFAKSVAAPKNQLGCTAVFGPVWGEAMDTGQARIQEQNFPKGNECNWQND
jgi:hypothetical protein